MCLTKWNKNSEKKTKKLIETKPKSMDQPSEPSTSKAKAISELHFNAISNASFRSNKSTSDQAKLLSSNHHKYVVTPMSQQSAPAIQINGDHKNISSPSSTDGPSTDPSSTTSPILSPIASRPKYYTSTRSLRSGQLNNVLCIIDLHCFIKG